MIFISLGVEQVIILVQVFNRLILISIVIGMQVYIRPIKYWPNYEDFCFGGYIYIHTLDIFLSRSNVEQIEFVICILYSMVKLCQNTIQLLHFQLKINTPKNGRRMETLHDNKAACKFCGIESLVCPFLLLFNQFYSGA